MSLWLQWQTCETSISNNSKSIKISSLDSGTEIVSLILTSSYSIHRDWKWHRSVGGQREEVSSRGNREQQRRGSVDVTNGLHVSSKVTHHRKTLLKANALTHNFTCCLFKLTQFEKWKVIFIKFYICWKKGQIFIRRITKKQSALFW